MTTTNQTAEEQLNVLWNQGFDEGGFFNETNPDVRSAMNWLIQNHKKGQEFVVTFGKPVPYTTFDKTKTDLQWAAEIKDQVEALSKDNGCPANM